MNSKYFYAFAGLMLGLTACSSGDLTSPVEGEIVGKTVHVTLTVDRSNSTTRTEVDENTDGLTLYSHWVAGDKLLVANSANQMVGELKIESIDEDDKSKAVFSGQATLSATEKYTLVYLGGSNGEAEAYATWTEGKEINNPVAEPDLENGFIVSSAKSDLCRADLMKMENVQFLVSGDKAYPTKNVDLVAVNAMAHFTLTGIPSELNENAVLTVNYGKITHTIATIVEDIYLPMPTGSYVLSFNLSNGTDSYSASINDGNEVTVNPGLYYVDADDVTNIGKGIEVVLKQQKPALKPNDDSDLIGASFEVNGKKFRFTKGNLKYTISTKTWSLHENQYDFLCQAGWTLENGKLGNNKTQEDVIDLYGFGATGLYDKKNNVTAQLPQFWRNAENLADKTCGTYYPTPKPTVNQGYTGSNLEHGIQFTSFDWGKAYYLCKREESLPTSEKPYTSYDWETNPRPEDVNDGIHELRYFTLNSKDWSELQSKYYICAATITSTGININPKANGEVFGCLIFKVTGTNTEKLAAAKVLLNKAKVDYIDPSLSANIGFSGTNYQYFSSNQVKMTKEQFVELEKLGVVFLPEAGRRAIASYTKYDGCYWTATAGQEFTATAFCFFGGVGNAYNDVKRIFKLDSSINRILGYSIRLVKEVPDNYEDPKVVD